MEGTILHETYAAAGRTGQVNRMQQAMMVGLTRKNLGCIWVGMHFTSWKECKDTGDQ